MSFYKDNNVCILCRNYIGDVALRHVLRNFRPDDVMIMHDADEIPVRETLLFLKVCQVVNKTSGIILKFNKTYLPFVELEPVHT